MTPAELASLFSPTPLPNATADPLADLRTALQSKDSAAVAALAHTTPARLLNTPQVMKEVVENFDPKTAETLFKKGLSLENMWNSKGWVGVPQPEFWSWVLKHPSEFLTPSDRTLLWVECWIVLTSNEHTDSPLRQTAALARTLLVKMFPLDFVTEDKLLDVVGPAQKNFSNADWDSIRAWPTDVWSEKSEPAVWSKADASVNANANDIQHLLKVITEVPHAAAALQEYEQKGLKLKSTIASWFASPTGKVEDLPLVALAVPKNRAALVKLLNKEVNPSLIRSPAHELHALFLVGCFTQEATNLLPKYIQNTIDEYGDEYWRTSVFDAVVRNGVKVLPHVPSTPDVEKNVFESLQEPVMPSWFVQSGNSSLSPLKIVERFPGLQTWKDGFGNSIFHWIAETNDSEEDASGLIEFLLQNPYARAPNNFGHTPMAVLVSKDTVTEEQRSKYEKAIVQQSLKEDDALASKLRSRSKTSGRKM